MQNRVTEVLSLFFGNPVAAYPPDRILGIAVGPLGPHILSAVHASVGRRGGVRDVESARATAEQN